MNLQIKLAADILLGGGLVTCPTEGIFGLSCLPDDALALSRLLALKQRDPAKGLILIAAEGAQFAGWIDCDFKKIPDPSPKQPVTWLVRAAPGVSSLVRGNHATLAVRITTNPIARSLCAAVDSPLVSTSANIAGQPVARNRYVLRRKFARHVDYVVPGDCGPASGPSQIRNLETGEQLR